MEKVQTRLQVFHWNKKILDYSVRRQDALAQLHPTDRMNETGKSYGIPRENPTNQKPEQEIVTVWHECGGSPKVAACVPVVVVTKWNIFHKRDVPFPVRAPWRQWTSFKKTFDVFVEKWFVPPIYVIDRSTRVGRVGTVTHSAARHHKFIATVRDTFHKLVVFGGLQYVLGFDW
jgi:hypothetical protein